MTIASEFIEKSRDQALKELELHMEVTKEARAIFDLGFASGMNTVNRYNKMVDKVFNGEGSK